MVDVKEDPVWEVLDLNQNSDDQAFMALKLWNKADEARERLEDRLPEVGL